MTRNGCSSCGGGSATGPGGNNFQNTTTTPRARQIRARETSCGTVTVEEGDGATGGNGGNGGNGENGGGGGIDVQTLAIGGAALGAAFLVARSRGN